MKSKILRICLIGVLCLFALISIIIISLPNNPPVVNTFTPGPESYIREIEENMATGFLYQGTDISEYLEGSLGGVITTQAHDVLRSGGQPIKFAPVFLGAAKVDGSSIPQGLNQAYNDLLLRYAPKGGVPTLGARGMANFSSADGHTGYRVVDGMIQAYAPGSGQWVNFYNLNSTTYGSKYYYVLIVGPGGNGITTIPTALFGGAGGGGGAMALIGPIRSNIDVVINLVTVTYPHNPYPIKGYNFVNSSGTIMAFIGGFERNVSTDSYSLGGKVYYENNFTASNFPYPIITINGGDGGDSGYGRSGISVTGNYNLNSALNYNYLTSYNVINFAHSGGEGKGYIFDGEGGGASGMGKGGNGGYYGSGNGQPGEGYGSGGGGGGAGGGAGGAGAPGLVRFYW